VLVVGRWPSRLRKEEAELHSPECFGISPRIHRSGERSLKSIIISVPLEKRLARKPRVGFVEGRHFIKHRLVRLGIGSAETDGTTANVGSTLTGAVQAGEKLD